MNRIEIRKANRQRKEISRARRKKLEKAAPALLKASGNFLDGWLHFCDCIDFGKSNLDGKAIRFMNEVPGEIQTAFNEATKG